MGNFGKCDITQKGHALLGKVISGKTKLVLTGTRAGDGIYGGEIWDVTELLSPRHDGIIASVEPNADGRHSTIECLFTNEAVTEYYQFNELAIYANDPDEGEIVYFYAKAGDRADYIPPFDGKHILEDRIKFLVYTANTADITVNLTAATCASEIEYDNTRSKLKATRVQSAIDEHIAGISPHGSVKTRSVEICLLFQKLANVIISEAGQVITPDEVEPFLNELSYCVERLYSGINYYNFGEYSEPVFNEIISSLQSYRHTGWAGPVDCYGKPGLGEIEKMIRRLQSGITGANFDSSSLAFDFNNFLSNLQAVANGKVDDSFFEFGEIQDTGEAQPTPPEIPGENQSAPVGAQYVEYQNTDYPEVTNIKQAIDAVIESVTVKRL